MSVAQLAGLSRRMSRISQQYQSSHRQRRICSGYLCGDSAAHGLSADEERSPRGVDVLAHRADHRAVAIFEDRTTIRNPPPLFCVEKVECDDVEAEVCQRVGELDHERALLTCPRAMSKHECGADRRVVSAAGGVDE